MNILYNYIEIICDNQSLLFQILSFNGFSYDLNFQQEYFVYIGAETRIQIWSHICFISVAEGQNSRAFIVFISVLF